MTAKLISLEGIECCGKSTQTQLLFEYLRQKKIAVQLTHEPGGSPYGEAIRALLKNPGIAMRAIFKELEHHSDFPDFKYFANACEAGQLKLDRTPECEMFLFEASRAEYSAVIRKILAGGAHVISDRLHDSTTAYQGGGRGLSKTDIDLMNRIALDDIWPDLTILLDIPVEVMLKRMGRQDDEKNAFFEQTCDKAFFERVRESYILLANQEPQRFALIDGTLPIETIFQQIKFEVDDLLGLED